MTARHAPTRLVLLALVALVTAGCAIPADVDGALDRLRDGGPLRVGVTEHEPWVSLAGSDPIGVEVGLVREFAARQGARVDHTTGSEQELVEGRHRRELDVVVGGVTDRTRWAKQVAMTKPYLTTHVVVGVPHDRGAPEGTRVAVRAGTEAERLLEREGGLVADRRDTLRGARGQVAAVDDWLLDDLGLTEARTLSAEEHVMLAAPGENALLVALERFLLDRKGRALALLEREGRVE